jgi:CubicO group peptidase (beta-lactamase class C family)
VYNITSNRVRSFVALGLLTLSVLPAVLPSKPASAREKDRSKLSPSHDPRRAATKALFADTGGPGRPGCAVGISRHGKDLASFERGEANLENSVPITKDSVFDTGSISKQFTAAAVQLLVADGRLSLSDEVHRFVPELPDYGKPVIVEQLMHHTSGMGDYNRGLFASGRDPGDVVTTAQALALIASQKTLDHDPGTTFQYSNSGYFLMSLVLERVSGMSLNEFTTKRIFEPLGMKHSRVSERYDELIGHRAEGYKFSVDGSISVARSNWQPTGDGQVRSTIGDLTLWGQELITGHKLGHAFREAMVTPGVVPSDEPDQAYGSGLYLAKRNGKGVIGHGGSWVGFTNDFRVVPELGVVAVALCNIDSIYPQIDAETFVYPGRAPGERIADAIDIWTS